MAPSKINKELKKEELIKVEYCFAYNKDNFQIEKSSLEELFTQPLLLPVKNSKQRTNLEKLLSLKSIISNPVMELENTEMMVKYIKEGLGIGYLQRSIAEQENFSIIHLEEQLPDETISLIYNEETLTSSSREFIKKLIDKEL